jgi:lysozyme
MGPSKELLADISDGEGYKKMPYPDTEGVMTAGIGYNLKANILGLSSVELNYINKNGMSETDAENYLIRCVKICIKEIEAKFDWWSKVDGVRQDAIINVVYNIGMPRFSDPVHGFTKTIGFLAHQRYIEAATELLDSKWASQVHEHRSGPIAQQLRTGKRV